MQVCSPQARATSGISLDANEEAEHPNAHGGRRGSTSGYFAPNMARFTPIHQLKKKILTGSPCMCRTQSRPRPCPCLQRLPARGQVLPWGRVAPRTLADRAGLRPGAPSYETQVMASPLNNGLRGATRKRRGARTRPSSLEGPPDSQDLWAPICYGGRGARRLSVRPPGRSRHSYAAGSELPTLLGTKHREHARPHPPPQRTPSTRQNLLERTAYLRPPG